VDAPATFIAAAVRPLLPEQLYRLTELQPIERRFGQTRIAAIVNNRQQE
jgi:hypothetical protein